jgi:probable rRNA maturation factor
MTIEVTNTSGQLVPTAEMTSLMTHALNALDLNPDCDLNIAFVEDDYMTELHVKWMDEPGTTDVLSFPMDMPEEPGEAVTLGDIVISPVVAAAQAMNQGHSTEHEIYILATHGLLHIIGYDHADKAEEKIMFDLQEKIVTDWEKEFIESDSNS